MTAWTGYGINVLPYPCDRGLGGMGVGYHEYVAANGLIFCKSCGHPRGDVRR